MTTFSRRLLSWYDRSHRELPWRVHHASGRSPDPYHVLLSEAMLQQTQVATVIPYFNRFIARFPTLADLAAAEEHDVLLLWQGLGYYSRARNLLAAAKDVMARFGGEIRGDVESLLGLPGVGRYTAGAIASIAFNRRAPILDGNVLRVLCRVDQVEGDPREGLTQKLLWERAEQIIPKSRAGEFNSAMMDLGATVCTPRSPACLACPVRAHCGAYAAGMQDRIPLPRKLKPTPLLHRQVFCIRRGSKWLIEQRPAKGRWAGLWQFVTVEAQEADGDAILSKSLPISVRNVSKIGMLSHALTHRRYHFKVFRCEAAAKASKVRGPGVTRERAWSTIAGLAKFPLPRPHLKVVRLLETMAGPE